MSTLPTTRSAERSAPSAIGLSIRGAILMLILMTIAGLAIGKNPEDAISAALAISLVGILSWNVYRLTSRRNDGMFLSASIQCRHFARIICETLDHWPDCHHTGSVVDGILEQASGL